MIENDMIVDQKLRIWGYAGPNTRSWAKISLKYFFLIYICMDIFFQIHYIWWQDKIEQALHHIEKIKRYFVLNKDSG